jgi:Tfp pilus assembly protein PilF
MKKKKKGTGILIAILLFVILAGAAVVFFGFINDPTAIEIRRYLAGKYVEKGNDDKAESLYYDILNRDETDTSSYLALGDIYLRSEDLEDAHEILREGLEYAPSQDIALKEWSVYEK